MSPSGSVSFESGAIGGERLLPWRDITGIANHSDVLPRCIVGAGRAGGHRVALNKENEHRRGPKTQIGGSPDLLILIVLENDANPAAAVDGDTDSIPAVLNRGWIEGHHWFGKARMHCGGKRATSPRLRP